MLGKVVIRLCNRIAVLYLGLVLSHFVDGGKFCS